MAQENIAPDGIEMDDLEDLIGNEEVEALRAERDELRDRFMRALADAENSRKRSERDRREAEQFGGSKLARDMLPVYDNLKRALEAASDENRVQAAALIEGLELTLRELTNVLARHGVTEVNPAIGDVFDPQQHQAMFEAPLPGTKAGQIIQVLGVGFMLHDRLQQPPKLGLQAFLLHDRLLRPAQVGVSSNTQG